MYNSKRLSFVSIIFLALFLFLSLPSAQSDDSTGNAPIMVAAQEATIPLTANPATGAAEECPYKLRIKAGALFLHRQDNDSRTLVANLGGGTELINADDLDLGFAAGMDISLMGQFREFGAELRYFGLHDWSESKTAGSTGALISYPSFTVGYFFPNGMNISADYNSKINNAEFNLHWWPCANERYHLLFGLRWIRLNERLDIDLANTVADTIIDRHKITADNRLWGGQLGIEGILLGNQKQGFSVNGFLKAGYYNNNLKSGMSEQVFAGSASRRTDQGTFVGEMGIGAQYAFTRNISLGARYQLLWLDHVALAPEQMHGLEPAMSPEHGGGSVKWDDVLYQGGWVGLTISF